MHSTNAPLLYSYNSGDEATYNWTDEHNKLLSSNTVWKVFLKNV